MNALCVPIMFQFFFESFFDPFGLYEQEKTVEVSDDEKEE